MCTFRTPIVLRVPKQRYICCHLFFIIMRLFHLSNYSLQRIPSLSVRGSLSGNSIRVCYPHGSSEPKSTLLASPTVLGSGPYFPPISFLITQSLIYRISRNWRLQLPNLPLYSTLIHLRLSQLSESQPSESAILTLPQSPLNGLTIRPLLTHSAMEMTPARNSSFSASTFP